MIDEIRFDLKSLKKEDPLLSVTMSKSHRLFNWQWGRSKHANFELVGVSNRLDRLSFSPKTCGEIRLTVFNPDLYKILKGGVMTFVKSCYDHSLSFIISL